MWAWADARYSHFKGKSSSLPEMFPVIPFESVYCLRGKEALADLVSELLKLYRVQLQY